MRRLAGRVIAVAALAAAVLPGVAHAAYDPSPPGANDFSCRPTAAHPRPLVLVHGLGATQGANWNFLAPQLHDAGWCVFSLTYGVDPRVAALGFPGGSVRMEESSAELAAFVDRVLAATGAAKVDLVGHSEGTVMPRWYLERRGGVAKVRRFVSLTPLWRGTQLLAADQLRDANPALSGPVVSLIASLCGSCSEFIAGSPYLNDLNADGEAIPGILHTNIATRYDELVVPYTSGIMRDGGRNIVLQDVCPNDLSEHAAIAFDPVAFQLVRNALDPKHPRPVRC
jgi:pimeloyl-ACP methyl ester carboxylesterase